MSKNATPQIEAAPRQRTGSRYAARVREQGKLPAVIYGHKQDPVSVSLDAKRFNDIIHHHAHLLEVVHDGQTESCLIKAVQWDHLGSSIIHVDLTRVDLNETVTVEIELTFTGDAPGLKEDENAIVEHPNTSIEIECVVTNIPDEIKVDISGLHVGDTLSVADLTLPEGVTAMTSEETVVAAVRIVEEVPEEDLETGDEEGAEPELIGREGDDEDGEGGDDADEKKED